ncbi:putative ferredoxin [Haematococcus lacustris]
MLSSGCASCHRLRGQAAPLPSRTRQVAVRAVATSYKVTVEHEGKSHVLQVPEGETVLSVALDQGLSLPHDCKLGVCMTCPAKLRSGTVDQSGSMLCEDVAEKGYVLMCVATPTSDCSITTISEDELLTQQFGM